MHSMSVPLPLSLPKKPLMNYLPIRSQSRSLSLNHIVCPVLTKEPDFELSACPVPVTEMSVSPVSLNESVFELSVLPVSVTELSASVFVYAQI